MFQASP